MEEKMNKQYFIKNYAKAIQEGYAAVFAGAGISVGAGYVDWKGLVAPFADEMGLDIDKEYDLTRVIQYYINYKRRRNGVSQTIINKFISHEESTKTIDLLTQLPVQTYWTTNYDKLLEKNLEKQNKKVDVKVTDKNLTTNVYDRDVVIYKMHGDVSNPDEIVLSKDDYELYNDTHSLFTTALRGDLVTKTFLFIGFSFEDPNLDNILSRIRVLLGNETREHYCFLEKITKEKYDDDDEFKNDSRKQELRIEDLKRYGIETILLDSYKEISDILLQIKKVYLSRNIFISGSISSYENTWDMEKVNKFSYLLSNNLVKKNNKIISGFGLGIGSNIINGALDEIYTSKFKHTSEHLSLHPFPQYDVNPNNLKERWTKLRVNMISEAGICIFIFGNKIEDKLVKDANGMIEEYKIAKKLNKFIIPVGATGYAAKSIFDDMKAEQDNYPYLDGFWDILEKEDDQKISETVMKIIENIQQKGV
ncbi:SIR2 family protein [Enterococcus faecalis]|uniref:SIR2 family protein n=2 Tax=Enterococcus faecalis TaxID=1351 RepID=UPI00027C808B|nr:hypothetical protein HMPREF1327_00331 [Enterococcus faecalis 599]